jgi:hypothetical protein
MSRTERRRWRVKAPLRALFGYPRVGDCTDCISHSDTLLVRVLGSPVPLPFTVSVASMAA